MISIFSSGLSALVAFGKKMEAIAGNVANFNSEGYQKKQAILKSGPDGGVVVDIQTAPTNTEVDLTEEIPRMLTVQRGYEANLKSIQTKDEALGTLIDLIE